MNPTMAAYDRKRNRRHDEATSGSLKMPNHEGA